MRVCFVVGTLGLGGSERQLVFMLKALIHRGISAKVLCLTRGEHFESEIRRMGVSVEYFGHPRSRAGRLLALARKLRNERVDVLHSVHFYTNLYVGVCGRILGIPSIGAIRSDFSSEVAAHGIWGRWQTTFPQLLLTNSTNAYSNATKSGIPPAKLGIVRNVVASDANGIKRNGVSALTILFVGRLDENKRPEKFVRLAHRLLGQYPDKSLRFLVAGTGPLLQKLQRLSAELGLTEGQIEFLGAVTDIEALYRKSDILVSTSQREGMPNVILEAMANGLAVVGTCAGGTIELLEHKRGVLVDLDDDERLAEAVASLISDTGLRCRLGRAGRLFIESNHSIGYLEERLPAIYEQLVNNGG